jgi:hypothetical protein
VKSEKSVLSAAGTATTKSQNDLFHVVLNDALMTQAAEGEMLLIEAVGELPIFHIFPPDHDRR